MFDWVGLFVMLVIGAGVWRGAMRQHPWTRALGRLPGSSAADLQEGRQAKLSGVVEPGPTLTAPLTGRPCVGWTVRAVVAQGGAGPLLRWGACDFVLRDDEGECVPVRAARASVVLVDGEPISAAREEGVVQRESVLVPGARVTVVGMVRRELDPKGTSLYREAPTRLVLDGIPLWILAL